MNVLVGWGAHVRAVQGHKGSKGDRQDKQGSVERVGGVGTCPCAQGRQQARDAPLTPFCDAGCVHTTLTRGNGEGKRGGGGGGDTTHNTRCVRNVGGAGGGARESLRAETRSACQEKGEARATAKQLPGSIVLCFVPLTVACVVAPGRTGASCTSGAPIFFGDGPLSPKTQRAKGKRWPRKHFQTVFLVRPAPWFVVFAWPGRGNGLISFPKTIINLPPDLDLPFSSVLAATYQRRNKRKR